MQRNLTLTILSESVNDSRITENFLYFLSSLYIIMSGHTNSRGLLSILYRKSGKQFQAAIISTIGVFCFGTALGSVIQEQRSIFRYTEYKLSETMQWEMVNAFLPLGTTVGSIPMGIFMKFFGCKPLMLLQFVPCLIGWTLMIFAEHIYMLYLARFLQGICGAAVSVAVPVYVLEISSLGNRGALSSLFFAALMYGVCFTSLMMTYIAVPIVNTINLLLTLLSLSVLIVPESPVYDTIHGKRDKAEASLRWLRQVNLTEMDFGVLMSASTEGTFSFTDGYSVLFTREAQRGCCRALFLLIVYQTCGGLATMIGLIELLDKLPETTYELALGVMVIAMVSGHLLCFFLVDRIGFRLMLLISCSIMTLSAISLGYWFQWIKNRDLGWGAIFNGALLIVALSSGIGPISWTLHVQLVIEAIRPYGCSTSVMYSWLVVFLMLLWRSKSVDDLNILYPIIIFSILGYLVVLIFVPETKGLTTHQIQILLAKYIYDDGSSISSA